MSRTLFLCPLAVLVLSGCKGDHDVPTIDKGVPHMQLVSPAFHEGKTIPKQYTADGKNLSPPLQWSGAPANTKSFALICDDPDAPRGTWVHWVLFNLPPDKGELPEAVPTSKTVLAAARQGTNSFKKIGYGGPDPPRGKPHRYYFKLYALDAILDLQEGATEQELLDALKGHILAEGLLMGTYGR